MANKKRDVLYILGAGASVASGVPAMATFVDKMYDLFLQAGEREDENISMVFDAIAQLRTVYANSDIDLDNIESVLAMFDMGRLTQSLGTFQKNETSELYDSLVKLIVRTVEETTIFDSDNIATTVKGHYGEFVHNAINRAKGASSRCDFVTFNYDIGLDYTLAQFDPQLPGHLGIGDYGFGDLTESRMLLKLHGSVNWFLRNDRVDTLPVRESDLYHHKEVVVKEQRTNGRYLTRLRYSKAVQAGNPLIVPPSFTKSFTTPEIWRVWQNAATLLASADIIVFIGYSVPPTDLMFKYLFSIGTLKNNRIRKVLVLNPDPAAESTYQKLLGQFSRRRLEFIEEKFDIDRLRILSNAISSV